MVLVCLRANLEFHSNAIVFEISSGLIFNVQTIAVFGWSEKQAYGFKDETQNRF